MRIKGEVYPASDLPGYFAVSIPAFDVVTQGISLEDGKEMALDAVQEILVDLVEVPPRVTLYDGPGGSFSLGIEDVSTVVALLLRAVRTRTGLSLKEVADRMGISSKNGVWQYEKIGGPDASVRKVADTLAALGFDLELNVVEHVTTRRRALRAD